MKIEQNAKHGVLWFLYTMKLVTVLPIS